ncbi:hypothetical protein PRIPAC_86247 [Pristionchus pacificus]|uniref:Uncharacterized protein n=1 Tax=Pristionchus pacificus TaxID=54126 RepID=A0A2A6BSF0_PRIPA|nr:hypothetical protein PRIPAC_86247 [Pristionchus pacificus]|eukprot:PDM68834.1 hypothetical protein PRIPAC_47136 [Pristionchus pacificus]
MRSLPYSPHVAELWVVHSSSSIEPFPFGRSQFDALPAHVCRLAASFLQPRAQQQLLAKLLRVVAVAVEVQFGEDGPRGGVETVEAFETGRRRSGIVGRKGNVLAVTMAATEKNWRENAGPSDHSRALCLSASTLPNYLFCYSLRLCPSRNYTQGPGT